MPPTEQLDQLHNLMKEINKGNATHDEVVQLFETVVKAVDTIKGQMGKQMALNHGELSDKNKSIFKEIEAIKKSVATLSKEIPKIKEKTTGDMDKVVVQIFKEVKRIESLIPKIPEVNFKPLEDRLVVIEKREIPKISAEKIRDELETLKGNERVDVSAINQAPRMTVSRTAPDNPQVGDLWGAP